MSYILKKFKPACFFASTLLDFDPEDGGNIFLPNNIFHRTIRHYIPDDVTAHTAVRASHAKYFEECFTREVRLVQQAGGTPSQNE
jgi:hypothetical protein